MTTTTTNDPIQEAAAAVREASRIAAEAVRETADRAKAAAEVARTYVDESGEANRKLFGAWSSEAGTALESVFAAQNAAIAAAVGIFDATVKLNHEVIEQWATLARQSQKTTLAALHATIRATEQTMKGEAPKS